MQTKNCKFALSLLLSASLFTTALFADGDPQLSTTSDSRLFDATTGDELYKASCQGCHMPDGKGANGAGFYPSLTNNIRLMSAKTTIEIVTNGLRGMPSFREYLSDDQIVEVVKYIRTNFGNNFKTPVLVSDIPK
jgi:mono/diheme cytochrome c family protein